MSAKVDLLFPKIWKDSSGTYRQMGKEITWSRTIVLQDPPRSVIIVAEIIRPQECCCHAELQDQ